MKRDAQGAGTRNQSEAETMQDPYEWPEEAQDQIEDQTAPEVEDEDETPILFTDWAAF